MVAQRRSEEKYTFTVDQVGDYQFCFSNLMSLSSYKTINIVTMVTLPRAVVVEGTDHSQSSRLFFDAMLTSGGCFSQSSWTRSMRW